MTQPLLKWPGGKRSELPIISPRIPGHQRYFEPFFGGGSVYFSCINVKEAYANDLNTDLMSFYRYVKNCNREFFKLLYAWIDDWETATLDERSEMYYCGREIFNTSRRRSVRRSVYFFLMRELAYGGMFRLNGSGEFNVPIGRVYAQSDDLMRRKADYLLSVEVKEKLETLELYNLDFLDFLNKFIFKEDDFMFVDPPYDTPFSSYDEDFQASDQYRLGKLLEHFRGKFMLVCKLTPLTEQIYLSKAEQAQFYVYEYEARYKFNIKGRFSRDTKHILVTNYDTNF